MNLMKRFFHVNISGIFNHFLIFLLILLSTSISQAAEIENSESTTSLFLHTKSGGIITYRLSDMPVITFNDNEVNVGDDKYTFSDISKYTFTNPLDSSVVTIMEESEILSYHNGKIIVASNVNENNCHITDIMGISYPLILTHTSAGKTEIDLNLLPTNTYILTLANRAIKFTKK